MLAARVPAVAIAPSAWNRFRKPVRQLIGPKHVTTAAGSHDTTAAAGRICDDAISYSAAMPGRGCWFGVRSGVGRAGVVRGVRDMVSEGEPLWQEARALQELMELRRDPVYGGAGL